MAKKHKSFKLQTNHNEMGIVAFAMIAGVVGVLIGAFLMYSSPGQQVLGVMTP